MHITQWIFRAEQQFGDREATEFEGRVHTWRQTADRVRRLAGALEGLGLQANDPIALLGTNSDNYLEGIYGIPLMGGIVVPMNIRWAVPEHVYSLQDSETKAILFDKSFLKVAEQIRSEDTPVQHYVYMGAEADCPEWAQSLEGLIRSANPVEEFRHAERNVAGYFYTGGTTGFPKGVVQTHEAIYASSIALVAAMRERGGECVCLHAAPMFHMADLAQTFGHTILGSKHVIVGQFEPRNLLRTLKESGVTHSLLVPAMIQLTFDHPEFEVNAFETVRFLAYGGSPMSEGLVRRVIEMVPHVKLFQAYGQTELAPMATLLEPEDHVTEGDRSRLLRSAGRACTSVMIRIEDEDGKVLPSGEVGEVCVSGPNAMLEYLNKPEETAKALQNGWIHTGDAGYLDDEGYLFIVDRTKDMIVSGGENVFSSEVESAVSTHPSVMQVAVVGIPDEKWGEAVHAIVIPKPGAERDAQAIIDHCRSKIAGYKCPKSVEFREEPMPLSGAGKVLKRELRAPYWEGRERRVN